MPITVSFTKRLIDIIISLIVLFCFIPFAAIVAILIKLDSPGPVFYAQRRVKRCLCPANQIPTDEDTFDLYKFRTMVNNAETAGAVNATENDPRVTRVGRFLRKSRLDEIPNFINVLVGDMSVVGPRADRLEIFKDVENDFPVLYRRTQFVKPGITGTAQLYLRSNGTLNPNDPLNSAIPESDREKETLSFRFKMYYDFAYTLKLTNFWSFLVTDLLIIVKTPVVMFIRRNTI